MLYNLVIFDFQTLENYVLVWRHQFFELISNTPCSLKVPILWPQKLIHTIVRRQGKNQNVVLSKNIFPIVFENVMFQVFLGNPAIATKLIVGALRNNNQRAALNEISWMDIKFVLPVQYLPRLSQVICQIWENRSFPALRTKFVLIIDWQTAMWNLHSSVSWWTCSTCIGVKYWTYSDWGCFGNCRVCWI